MTTATHQASPPNGGKKELRVQPGRFQVAGRPVTCPHCANDVFIPAAAPNTAVQIQAAGGPAGASVGGVLICMDCTRIEWFINTPKRIAPAQVEHGAAGVQAVGHRKYVGGLWDEVGRLQFEFLLREGLRPEHVLLDIACGSLRAGVWFIPYLDPGHYLGIEKEQSLIDAALEHELPAAIREVKRPRLLVDGEFAFERFETRPDFALAQSLFSHFPPEPIERCFNRLRPVIADGGRFYATFFQTDRPIDHTDPAHDHKSFAYTRDEMLSFGERTGWRPTYLGDWNHPRGQVIVRYDPA